MFLRIRIRRFFANSYSLSWDLIKKLIHLANSPPHYMVHRRKKQKKVSAYCKRKRLRVSPRAQPLTSTFQPPEMNRDYIFSLVLLLMYLEVRSPPVTGMMSKRFTCGCFTSCASSRRALIFRFILPLNCCESYCGSAFNSKSFSKVPPRGLPDTRMPSIKRLKHHPYGESPHPRHRGFPNNIENIRDAKKLRW